MNRVPNNCWFHILEHFSQTWSDNKYRCYMLFANAMAWDWKLNAMLLLKRDYPIAAVWSNSRIFRHSKQRDTSRLCSEQLSVCALNICNHLWSKWSGNRNSRVTPLPVDLLNMVRCTEADTNQVTSVPASSGAKVHSIFFGNCSSVNVTLPSLLKGSLNIEAAGFRLNMETFVRLGSG
jgi:hypothetical protein